MAMSSLPKIGIFVILATCRQQLYDIVVKEWLFIFLKRAMDKHNKSLRFSMKHNDLDTTVELKKRLRFQQSKIHDWGLVALEPIEAEDFVIEYVGELIRPRIYDIWRKWELEQLPFWIGRWLCGMLEVEDDVHLSIW
ncbi:histone-lysine N-methyltransferase, H3 lysine-4 specific-like [Rutidosis leptorrhynchoides]|uniref:histone-lysine N-methyltransferase, H3 lysine-4 specific-like n=1 Tax=Rutidosis leptorrhynchoides TaxID=125765 RepID=UPI003A9978DE